MNFSRVLQCYKTIEMIREKVKTRENRVLVELGLAELDLVELFSGLIVLVEI